ncbi:MAG: DUF3082 domain-containing protein [Cyanobacteria bacterium P01_A01_bin.83]
MKDTSNESAQQDPEIEIKEDKTTPLRCFASSLISGTIAYGAYSLLQSITQTYGAKAITSTNPLVINITTAVRTLVMGIVALGTGVFSLATVGLFLLGIQLALQKLNKA